MMRVMHVTGSLSAYLDDQLSPGERARVVAHLDGCALCRARYEELRQAVALVRGLDPVRAPDGLQEAVRSRLAEGAHPRGTRAWWPLRRPSWRTAWAAAAVVLIGLFSLNLLRSATPPALLRSRGPAPEPAVGVAPPAATDQVQAPGKGASPIAPGIAAGPLVLRQVIRTASLSVEVDAFDAAVRRLVTIAEGAGGFVASSSSAQGAGGPEGTFVLRVPAPRFSTVLGDVEGLGRVRERRISGQDVSEEFVDLRARVRNLERHEQRLLAFMDRATKVSDLLAIEQELARVRGEIEALTGRLRLLSNQVDLATVEVAVRQKPEKVSGGFWDFGATLDRMRAAFLATIRQLLAAVERLGIITSALAPILVLVAVGWLLIRRLRARAF